MSNSFDKADRAENTGLRLTGLAGMGNLAIASIVTMGLISGLLLALILGITLISNSQNPGLGLGIAIAFTLVFNAAFFFTSPFLMDLSQKWLYQTEWITLDELAQRSPESAEVVARVCRENKISQPRLGLIDDQNPTAFTYGTLRNNARLVVSAGLFTYLDDDEIATVYAHELGHIVHWDFAVMTVASTLVQIMYLIYVFARRLDLGEKAKGAAQVAALVAYIFYEIGTYLLLYLSRTREYFADMFAAETTANPNALSRALVKIAYGIVEEGERSGEPSQLAEGTRTLGIYDAKAATSTGTAYRVAAKPEQVGRVFLWDLYNPWGGWLELNSTHPLTGKRVRALSNYAEQLDLAVEFDMARVVAEGRTLDKKRLYSSFVIEVLLHSSDFLGAILGFIFGAIASNLDGDVDSDSIIFSFGTALIGYGIGGIIKTLASYPNYKSADSTNVLSLMSDPYASPLRGTPAKLQGKLIGRGDAGNNFGSDLQLKDRSGLMYLHYASRFGAIGNFLFGMKRVQSLIGMKVEAIGWFRRGVTPYMDLIQLKSNSGTVVNSYHRFWAFVVGFGALALGLLIATLPAGA